jgi:peroxiredoxin
MMKRSSVVGGIGFAVAAMAVVAMVTATGSAGAAEKGVKVGEAMPDFTLKSTDGKEHTLSKYKGKVVVLDFSCQDCPWSRGADGELIQMAKNYEDKGVVFLGIESSKSTTPVAINEYIAEREIPFPILKDMGNAYADKVNAQVTPEIFILNKEGKLAYHGAFDNRRAPEVKGEMNYVASAVDELLAGNAVSTSSAKAKGCGIKRAAKRAANEGSAKEESAIEASAREGSAKERPAREGS